MIRAILFSHEKEVVIDRRKVKLIHTIETESPCGLGVLVGEGRGGTAVGYESRR